MTKFVKVKDAPKVLTKSEYVIPSPSFVEEISSVFNRAPKNKKTSSNFLRDVAQIILDKYKNNSEIGNNAALKINTTGFRGIPFQTVEDINEVISRMFMRSCPSIFNDFVDYHIKNRPFGTKLIYFLGDHLFTQQFTVNGIDEITEKEIDTTLNRKKKQTKNS